MPAAPITEAPVNFLDHEDIYNVVVLGGTPSPGQVTLSGHNRKANWDVQAGPFLNGARTVLKSIPPVEFSASFYLLRDLTQGIDDLAKWPDFRRLIESTLNAAPNQAAITVRPKALPIYHPALAANKITSVVQAEIGGEVYDKKGGMTVVVKFLEYRPPRPYGGAATPSKTGVDPNADAKAEVKRLTDQYKATPWG